MKCIHLIRHGQASFGEEDYDRLSDVGERQAEELGRRFAGQPRLALVSGTMRRQRDTARGFAREAGLSDDVDTRSEWDEFDHLDVIGQYAPELRDGVLLRDWLTRQEQPLRAFQRLYEAAVARWVEQGDAPAGYRESHAAFVRRVMNGWAEVIRDTPSDGTAIVFTSAGPIAAVAGSLLGVPVERRGRLERLLFNTGMTTFLGRGDRMHLSTLNVHDHLASHPALLTYR